MRRNFWRLWSMQGLAMYRWVYWGGVAVFVAWTVFSAYSVLKGY